MNILVLNCGSSSIKYQLLDMGSSPRLLCKGLIERVGQQDAIFEHAPADGRPKQRRVIPIADHAVGIDQILKQLVDPVSGVIGSIEDIAAAGHRVAHGANLFDHSVLITPEVESQIEACAELAPLHNPANLTGIRAMRSLLPGLPQVAVFDTAFHHTIPQVAHAYAIPNRYYTDLKVRKYGFHGTSHQYVAQRAEAMLHASDNSLKIITCHLGNGASVSAIDHGRSVDTSMGFTPVDGLVMGTRCGEIDPSALLYIAKAEGKTLEEVDGLINKQSGLYGLSGVSHDMRDICDAAAKGNEWASLAREMFIYRLRKYIGAYHAVLQGVDAIVFTGGIGENDKPLRLEVSQKLAYLGAFIDPAANETANGKESIISTAKSQVALLVIPTNEELVIATDTQRLVGIH